MYNYHKDVTEPTKHLICNQISPEIKIHFKVVHTFVIFPTVLLKLQLWKTTLNQTQRSQLSSSLKVKFLSLAFFLFNEFVVDVVEIRFGRLTR